MSDSSGTASRAQARLLLTALAVTVADQAVKRAVASATRIGESVDVIGSFVRITRTSNTGGAFGIFRGRAGWFIVVSVLAAAAIVAFSRQLAKARRIEQTAFALILGGAVGNLIDRIRVGAVVDFIDIGGSAYRWPAFNVADSCITIGVTLLAVSLVFLRSVPSELREAPPGSGARTDAGDGR
ncbi:MAG: signal peptidase II [Candidatus Eisenbacteria bacterium]|nr:signal peptidase II [Candidatus Eisenbacteria bacterium]